MLLLLPKVLAGSRVGTVEDLLLVMEGTELMLALLFFCAKDFFFCCTSFNRFILSEVASEPLRLGGAPPVVGLIATEAVPAVFVPELVLVVCCFSLTS